MFGQQSSIAANKQVCSFYLKGNCKYGTQCWNVHPPNQAIGGMSSAFGVGNVFGAKTGSTQPDSKEFTEFVKQVSGEMTQWERSGQWLFSSFAPLKSHPMLAGFSDLSPEELRGKAYDALKANTSTAYQDHWSKLQQQYKQLRDALRVPTPDAYQAMKEVFHAKGSSEQQQQTSSQAVKQTTSLFGKPSAFGGSVTQPQPGAGLLGAKPQSSIFGGGSLFSANQPTTTSLFGDTSKKPLFGGTPALGSQNTSTFGTQPALGTQNTSTFGTQPALGTQNTSTFGTQPALGSQNTSTFGTQPNVSPFAGANNNLFKSNTSNNLSGGSVFGGPPKIQGNPLFGGGTGTTATSPVAGNIFGSSSAPNTTPATGNIFGGASSTNVTTTAAGNIFGGGASTNTTTPATGSLFGGATSTNTTQATGSIFGGATSTNTAPPAAGGIFGSTPNQTSNLFGNNNQNQSSTFAGIGTGAVSNVFGSNVFGNKPSVFGGPQTQPQQQQSTSLFGNPPTSSSSIFGGKPLPNTQTQNSPPSIFGGNAGGSTFSMTPGSAFSGGGNAPNPSGGTGLFGNAPGAGMQTSTGLFGNTSDSPSTTGLFGKPPESQQTSQTNMTDQPTSNLFGGGNKVSSGHKAEWFTPLDQLDLADKAQFEADVFTAIPLCAPPLECCF